MNYSTEFIKPELKNEAKSLFSKNHILERALGYVIEDNAMVVPCQNLLPKLPGGVLDSDGCFLLNTSIHERSNKTHEVADREIVQEDSKVIFIGNFLTVWGHMLTDNLKKFWFLRTNICKQMIKEGWIVVYVTYSDEDVSDIFSSLCKLADVDLAKFRRITKPTRFKSVCIPDSSFVWNNDARRYTKQFVDTINLIREKALSIPIDFYVPDYVYFSRSKFSSINKEIGEKRIEKLFAQMGYTILYPEELSIEVQICIWNKARRIVTTEGSIAHTAILGNKNVELVILQKADYFNGYQLAINQIVGCNVIYITAHHSIRNNPMYVWGGPFYLCVTKELKRFLNIKKCTMPYFISASWWLYMFKDTLLFRAAYKILHVINIL